MLDAIYDAIRKYLFSLLKDQEFLRQLRDAVRNFRRDSESVPQFDFRGHVMRIEADLAAISAQATELGTTVGDLRGKLEADMQTLQERFAHMQSAQRGLLMWVRTTLAVSAAALAAAIIAALRS